jgi:replicative superfamily II helicase
MDVFDLRNQIVSDYAAFTRSFTRIKAPDVKAQVDEIYAGDKYWPEPLLQLSPHFEPGPSVQELAVRGELHATTAAIFHLKDDAGGAEPLRLHTHQAQALAAAKQGESFVVTTGTGSGKSLCFFIPIVDAVVRARQSGAIGKTAAVIVYPMNALANSQIEEIEKFLENVVPAPISVERYTGQEEDEERRRIADNPPDILLTNFMMLEYLMTRQDDLDKKVIGNCAGLRFLVLDELHTYRGRQGADVALLVRRLRARLAGDRFQCIGTSATMASGTSEARNEAVARVASRLFGVAIKPTQVIGETLRRVTDSAASYESVKAKLSAAIEAGLTATIKDSELVFHPLAIWVETRLGLDRENGKWVRAKPRKFSDAAKLLAEDSGAAADKCASVLKQFLLLTSLSEPDRPLGQYKTGRGFFAFRLHQFIAGAGVAYATLEPAPGRRVTTNGQQFLPDDPSKRLYSVHFCRECGQEYYPVSIDKKDTQKTLLPREIDDVPPKSDEEDRDRKDREQSFGFVLVPPTDAAFDFDDRPTDYPEDWLEPDAAGEPRLKAAHHNHRAQRIQVDPSGRIGGGNAAWFIPGKFRFCLACKTVHSAQGKDNNRLASLSAEGRSSATTLFTHSVLRWMGRQTSESIPLTRRKLLGFTDNRQDAALQAGHFNDFLFVSLLRAGMLGATTAAGTEGLTSDRLGIALTKALGFDRNDKETRAEWLVDAELEGAALVQAQRTLRELLSYRAWFDQRKGWRFNNPNLEQLGLLEVEYAGLQDLAEDDDAFAGTPELLASASPDARLTAYRRLFDALRQGLALDADVLVTAELDALKGRAAGTVRQPWGFSRDEKPRGCRYLLLAPPARRDNSLADEDLLVRGGFQSQLGKTLRQPESWGDDVRSRALKRADYEELLAQMLEAARKKGFVVEVPTPFGNSLGWQLKASCIVFKRGSGTARKGAMDNSYFRDLYANLAEALVKPTHGLFKLEAREHTAQVEGDRRELRELRFRYGTKEQAELEAKAARLRELGEAKRFLPVLYCSPTMELGVDISALNVVYLRNVPPTPANYAQRSGRAGRSGMPALVLTYTAARSPHDQYFFADPPAMVHGEVRTPTLDLANEELVRSHLNAVWMACTDTRLDASIAKVIEPDEAKGLPLRDEVRQSLTDTAIAPRAKSAMLAVLTLLEGELTPTLAPWFSGKDALADDAVQGAFQRFDQAFGRWRELFQSAARQRDLSRKIMDNHALPERERNAARVLHGQAIDQLNLLQRGKESSSSDYYTYRYLATEGFLPGYNFPRLPLIAFIPGTLDTKSTGAYLQRPRFLALSEFGPRSLVYHEGRAYRVTAAMLGVRDTASGNDTALLTDVVTICRNCGGGHFRSDPHDQDVSHCRACGAALTDNSDIVKHLYRIENVSTRPAERITVNDEERKRQGFELQTTFRWARRENGQPDVRTVVAADSVGVVARLNYGPGAEISRINKGLRRRANPQQHGFRINPVNGQWAKLEDDDTTGEDDPTQIRAQLIVPWVRDQKNALLFHLGQAGASETTIATVQYALKRGVETVFQLEESELLAEPVPDRKSRKGVLFYEATEGGAGVLTRLVHDEDALARVAHAALRAMHFNVPDFGHPMPVPDAVADVSDADCVAGCYRCLLSYFNQPDHLILDRKDKTAVGILLRLASSKTSLAPPTTADATPASPPTGTTGFDAATHGLPAPDAHDVDLAGSLAHAVWRSKRVAVLAEGADPAPWMEKGVQTVHWSNEPTPQAQAVERLGQWLN